MRMRIIQIYKVRQPPVRRYGSLRKTDTCHQLEPSSSVNKDILDASDPVLDKLNSDAVKDLLPNQESNPSLNMSAVLKAPKCPCMAIKVMAFAISIPFMRDMLRQHWGAAMVEEVEATADACIFRVTMKLVKDKKLILQKRLWVMSNIFVLVEEWKEFEDVKDHCFRYADFQVQLINLPRQILREDVIRNILKKVGEVSKVSLFLGVPVAHVKIDLRMPIWPAVPVVFSGFPIWVSLAYENIKNVCYSCGFLGHSVKQCKFINKPFACQFNAANPEFPFHKLGRRMKEFSLVSGESEAFFFKQDLQNHEVREPVKVALADCDFQKPASKDSGISTGGVEKDTVLANNQSSGPEVCRDKEVQDERVGKAEGKHGLVTTFKAEEISLAGLSNKLNFGEPFCPTTSADIFRLTQDACEKKDSLNSNNEDMKESDQLNSFLHLCSKGKYPLTNYFSPQYSIFLSQFLRRREAKLVIQVTLDEEEPTIIIHQNYFKATLKTYHRRTRGKVSAENLAVDLHSGTTLAGPPIPKVRKLKHHVNCDLDSDRELDPLEEITDLRERKKPSRLRVDAKLLSESKARPKPVLHKKIARKFFIPTLETITEVEEGAVLLTENLKKWRLSEGEEVTLSVLSKGLREVDKLNLSQVK